MAKLFMKLFILFILLFSVFCVAEAKNGKFVEVGKPEFEVKQALTVDNKVILLNNNWGTLKIAVFDNNLHKIVKSGQIPVKKSYNPTATVVNDKEICITIASTEDKVRIYNYFIDLDSMKIKKIDTYYVKNNQCYNTQYVGDGNILFTGNFNTDDPQAFLLKDGKKTSLTGAEFNYRNPKILKLNNDQYIIVGSLKDRRDDITEIDLFDVSTKTAKEIYREKIQGYSFSDAFLVSGNRLAVIIGDNPCTPYMHKKLLLIDLKTGKVLNEADLNPDSKLVQTSIAQTINDKLIIYGGATGLYKPNNKAFIYDVNKNTFTKSDRTNIYHQVNFSKNVLMKDGNTFLVGFLYYPEDSLIEIFVP